MTSFIERLVALVAADTSVDPRTAAIVFSTKRAGIFFKKAWADSLKGKQSSWVPKIYSIEEFAADIAGLPLIDTFGAVCELFNVIKGMPDCDTAGIPKQFSQFYEWGTVIVREFDDIDTNLADCDQLFRQLKETVLYDDYSDIHKKKLGDSAYAKAYEDIRNRLPVLYQAYRGALATKNVCTQGQAFRKAVEVLRDGRVTPAWESVIFAGFNALTTAEKELMNYFSDKGGRYYWDMDRYFTDATLQEAGHFFRKYREESFRNTGECQWIDTMLADEDRSIIITGVADKESQAKIAGDILSKLVLDPSFKPEKTAVVLADESLLFPVLNSIPKSITTINISMGYPIRFTPMFTLLSAYRSLHENVRRMKTGGAFYYKDVCDVLMHPYVLSSGRDKIYEDMRRIRKDKLIYVRAEDLQKCMEIPLCRVLFATPERYTQALELLRNILTELRVSFVAHNKASNALEFEYIYAMYTMINRIADSIASAHIDITVEDLDVILREMLTKASIPFTGEPVDGLQIMGYLETRALDFDTVIMLSVNEGIVPVGKNTDGFVPHDLQLAHGIPTYSDKDAISAYHFYRLLKRTKRAYYIYSTVGDGIGKGERSRFLEQLLYEYKEQYPARVTSTVAALQTTRVLPEKIAYPNSDESIKRISSLEFSPSGVNAYLKCKLKFFFQYILGIREDDEMKETPDVSLRGSIVHHALQLLYADFVSNTEKLTEENYAVMKSRIHDAVEQAFRAIMGNTVSLDTGVNCINKTVVEKQLERLLNADKDFACEDGRSLFVVELEQRTTKTITLPSGKLMKIKGFVDRIDRIEDADDVWYRVIDYKTGKATGLSLAAIDALLKVAVDKNTQQSLFSTENAEYKYDQALQLLWYWYLSHDTGRTTKVGISQVQKASEGISYLEINKKDALLRNADCGAFEAVLDEVYSDMTNLKTVFAQTENEKNCKYCSCLDICTRKEAVWNQ